MGSAQACKALRPTKDQTRKQVLGLLNDRDINFRPKAKELFYWFTESVDLEVANVVRDCSDNYVHLKGTHKGAKHESELKLYFS